MTSEQNPSDRMKVSDLVFDLSNPRLSEYDLTANSTEKEVIKVLWDAMDVRELVMSIAGSGFFPHEPIIVANEDSKNVVIEGNRRLAAVKLLLEPDLVGALNVDVPEISHSARLALQELPIVSDTRESAWHYLGFKHVNGPAKWSSYAKSRYIAKVHREFKVPLEDIARQIGDTHKTVQRLYRGLMVLEEADDLKVFSRDDRWNRHFSFSHLYTGIDYDGISSFIGLRPETDESDKPVPIDNKEELRELLRWLYGSKKEDTRPVIRSQNPDLRNLDTVLSNREAVAALRAGRELAHAVEISRPASNVFEESLHAAKRDLEKARSLLSTGYDGSEQLFRIAGDVADLANDLYDDMERKRNPRPRKRVGESR